MNPAQPFVIFEMANNHMGSLSHGTKILEAFAQVVEPYRPTFTFGFKLQYRDLDTFIHPAYKGRRDVKFVKRFEETRLTDSEFLQLRNTMRKLEFQAVCTPFDEISVDRAEAHEFNHLKIASCSLGDWPLIERIVTSPLPVIASTAGADLDLLDRVVSFFLHRNRPLSLMHCVAEYPTEVAHFQLNQLDLLRQRYPSLSIGFSTHEDPDNPRFVQMALAKGASILEKHVGLPTPDWPLNAYSANPKQIAAWLEAAAEALLACGTLSGRHTPEPSEMESLHGLQRGLFAREPLNPGERIDQSKLLLAMPTVPDQLTTSDLSKYIEYTATEPIEALGPVLAHQVRFKDHREQVRRIVHQVRALLEASHTVVGQHTVVEISHHYGLERFPEAGATILNIVNRVYCKKLIVLLPGQRHPEQHHKKKEETFHLLYGDLSVRLDGVEHVAQVGDVITVEPTIRHEFWTEAGAVIEEVSSTHYSDDSYYTDPLITANPNRKTLLTHFFG